MGSEIPVNAALAALAIAAGLSGVLFLYSLGLRVAHSLHDRDLRKLQIQWWPVLAEAASNERLDERTSLVDLKAGSGTKVLREWCRFRSLVKGEAGNAMGPLAAELGLHELARRQLRRRSVSNRLVAMQALGFLRDVRSWRRIESMLGHANVSISITAATALVRISPVKAIHQIMPLIGTRGDWPRTQIGRILNHAGPTVVSRPLCKAIEMAGEDEAIHLLQFYESAYLNEIDSLVATLLLRRHEPGLIAAALKAVRGQLPINILARLARHNAWYVRMQAATLLGRFGRREDYRLLEPMLADTEWWVRYRAAQAITKLPFLGPRALHKLCHRQEDRFARDILHQALAEAGLS